MSSAVAELEAGLQAMLSLKPPGVSGSRISSITSLCMANVQSESILIQKLYTHFKKAPATHKLGVLYVVDSVARKWTEHAKAAGQTINSSATDGTFAAGVNHVKELLPSFMNDIILSAPDDQKEKIKKLVDIWEKGSTFPLAMLTPYKEKLNAPSPIQNRSTTPAGSPPPSQLATFGIPQASAPAAPAQNTSSILAALANIAKQNTSTPPANPTITAQGNSYGVANVQPSPAQHVPQSSQTMPVAAAPVNPLSYIQGQTSTAPIYPSSNQPSLPNAGAPGLSGLPGLPQVAMDPAVQKQLLILKTLADQGVPQEQWGNIIAALTAAGAAGSVQPPASGPAQNQSAWGGRPDESRDRNGYRDGIHSPGGQYRRRSRSQSPSRGWVARNSPNSRRHDPYGRDVARGDDNDRSGRSNGHSDGYRQRSPTGRRGRSPSPPHMHGNGVATKWTDYDPTIGKGNIKVLSRTLFVGGVTMSDRELRSIFERFGNVQTCIVNKDKRHAFVKMISRKDALAAKEAMESNRSPDSQLRTRWGVGFGPRDCSDYQTGVSIIPISKLTDADRKWMLSAEYGGTGGGPIEGGLVVEEPDIEIGQGVSSKAISRRMQTDKGGNNGPKSSRDREEEPPSRFRRFDERNNNRNDYRNENPNNMSSMPNGPPIFPHFPLPPGLSGLSMFPPGFPYPSNGQQNQQPPPPGY